MNYSVGECVKVPTFVPEDLRERLEQYVLGQFIWMPWSKLYRRDFLLENRIEFPQMKFAEDVTFCFKCLCLAKKYLHVPHVTNIRRERSDSAARIIRACSHYGK